MCLSSGGSGLAEFATTLAGGGFVLFDRWTEEEMLTSLRLYDPPTESGMSMVRCHPPRTAPCPNTVLFVLTRQRRTLTSMECVGMRVLQWLTRRERDFWGVGCWQLMIMNSRLKVGLDNIVCRTCTRTSFGVM